MMIPKRIKHILFTACLLVIGIFMLNLFLSKNLERYLKKELSIRTARATGGFYLLSFEKLSISFFKGELRIRGIELRPDPETFRKWEKQDSLPSIYVRTKIESIDFKGVNLTWRWNYRTLRFDSFKIESPEIDLFTPPSTDWQKAQTKHLHTQTLYELISPYINTLSVKELDLGNASITYTVSNNMIPTIYALKQINFHAYGFLLDANSSQNGKLLYCDNFDFSAKEPQIIVSNDVFSLQTGNIRLQTKDSVIYIDNIQLFPRKELWKKKEQIPERYLDGYIRNIRVHGVYFKRKKAQSYLYAHAFDLTTSEINLFETKRSKTEISGEKSKGKRSDSNPFSNVPSLYDIVSPVLHRAAVDHINIDNTKLTYTINSPQGSDLYKVNDLRLQTDEFLIAPENKDKPIGNYFRRFIFEASGVLGNIESQNQHFNLKRMIANTEKDDILFEEIVLAPLSEDTAQNSISGKIDSIYFNGLSSDSIITVDQLSISSPDILFIKRQSSANTPDISTKHLMKSKGITASLPSYIPSFQIHKIHIKDGRIHALEKNAGDSALYSSKHIYLSASDVIYENQKGTGKQSPFHFKTWQLAFSNFDNSSTKGKYRLQIRKGNISSGKGSVLQDIQFFSGRNDTKQLRIHTPFLQINGTIPTALRPFLRISSIRSDSLDIKYTNGETQEEISVSTDALAIKQIFRNKETASVNTVRLVRPDILINRKDETSPLNDPETIHSSSLYQALSVFSDKISLDTLLVNNAEILYTHTNGNGFRQSFRQDSIFLKINGIHILNSENKLDLENIHLNAKHINIPLDKGFYSLKIESLDWNTDTVQLYKIHFVSPYSMMEFAYKQPQHKDWFDVYAESLFFSKINFFRFFSEKTLQIGNVQINDILLQNFKNKQIEVPKRIIPMVYSGLQKAPVKIVFDTMNVNNMSVIYQELDPGRTAPGKLFFTEMNGRFSGFTNIATQPGQYITLNADGKLMGKGNFKATWLLPVDSTNNQFLLNATLDHLDLPDLNEIITPLASAQILSGQANDVSFKMDASDTSGNISLTFPYENLKINILKDKKGDISENAFVSRVANWVIKQNNPNERGHLPRTVDMHIKRDPYHSTFNYLWQMLRPALTESIGISKTEQEIATESMHFIRKIKHFFKRKKKNSQKDPTKPRSYPKSPTGQ